MDEAKDELAKVFTSWVKEWAAHEDWIREPDRCVFVWWNDRSQQYELVLYWIEFWRPGNYGLRLRGDAIFEPRALTDMPGFLREVRRDAVEGYIEMRSQEEFDGYRREMEEENERNSAGSENPQGA